VVFYEESRKYLLKMLAVSPVLLHFGLLVMTFNYLFSVLAMELLSRPAPSGVTDAAKLEALYEQSCARDLPHFDCFGEAFLSIFRVFIENNWGDVLHARQADASMPPLTAVETAAVNGYFVAVYAVMGIGLCNLVTTIVVEFNKVVEEEEEMQKTLREKRLVDIKAKMRRVFRGLRHFESMRRQFETLCSQTPPIDNREVMVGHHNANWRAVHQTWRSIIQI